jgi:hypothetical protein
MAGLGHDAGQAELEGAEGLESIVGGETLEGSEKVLR